MDMYRTSNLQNNSVNAAELKQLIADLKAVVPEDMPKADKEALHEGVETIESELAQQKPKRSLVNTAIKVLQAIKGTTEFAAVVAALVQFIQALGAHA